MPFFPMNTNANCIKIKNTVSIFKNIFSYSNIGYALDLVPRRDISPFHQFKNGSLKPTHPYIFGNLDFSRHKICNLDFYSKVEPDSDPDSDPKPDPNPNHHFHLHPGSDT